MKRQDWIADPGHARWLSDSESQTWQAMVKMIDILFSRIGRELAVESGLSFVDYQILITLVDVEGEQTTMTALAASLGWSRSRVSHQVRRMEARGLVERAPGEADRRNSIVRLGPAGLRRLRAAAPGQAERVRRHFFDQLAPEQLAALAEAHRSLLDYLAGSEDFPDLPAPSQPEGD
ncbi:MAG: MarR family winged helix-turn-helix transcriptional regulator [Segniliparus sp.]|uniref:MarR family winged helix-turn-helix transcriptional regulator n=1 Tax=Segniliparus sp. TaxID=2804064 RepID=UPI003F30C744